MEIAAGIHLIPGLVGQRPLQLFLLRGEQQTVLLDTGSAPDPEKIILPYLAQIGLRPSDVTLVINTHADLDHCGGNAAFKRLSPRTLLSCGEADRALIEDPQVMWARRYNRYASAHGVAYDEADRRWIMEMLGDPQPVDLTWTAGEVLRLGPDWTVEILATPGHSAGHLALFDARRRILLCGDAVHGAVYLDTAGRPALCPTYVDVDAYLGTIRFLRSLQADLLCGCHWPIKRGRAEVEAFLDETEQFVRTAERVVIGAMADHPEGMTLAELIAEAGPRLGEWPRAVDQELMYALAGHLDRLVVHGQARVDATAQPVRYRLVAQER